MSDTNPGSIKPAVTDAVTPANVKVLGDAPATAMAHLFQATSSSLPGYPTGYSSPGQAGAHLYSIDTGSAGVGTVRLINRAGTGV